MQRILLVISFASLVEAVLKGTESPEGLERPDRLILYYLDTYPGEVESQAYQDRLIRRLSKTYDRHEVERTIDALIRVVDRAERFDRVKYRKRYTGGPLSTRHLWFLMLQHLGVEIMMEREDWLALSESRDLGGLERILQAVRRGGGHVDLLPSPI